jgi:hypothetical protein
VTVTVRRSSRSGVLAARCLLMRIHGWRWMGLCRRQSRSRDNSSFVCRDARCGDASSCLFYWGEK